MNMSNQYLPFKSRYDKYPQTKMSGAFALEGYTKISEYLKEELASAKIVIFEYYPGIDEEEIKTELIARLGFDKVINITDYAKPIAEVNEMIKLFLTDDRIFGIMSKFVIEDFYDANKITALKAELQKTKQRVAIYGFGASLIKGDKTLYFDLCRWETQLRFRNGMPNWRCDNYDEDPLRKYKRGFFIDWRTADRLKKEILKTADFYLDTNTKGNPKLIETASLFKALKKTSLNPFRLVPYFDPGVWGGQWMKEVCGLDPEQPNFAWSFDGVPEENSLYFDFDGVRVETPAINLVFFEAVNLLGERVYGRFGHEFPIRFDFLDTFEGQNLSLQVHPLIEYIQDKFGMTFTQDESYYILDAKADARVYLGLIDGTKKEEFKEALVNDQIGKEKFDATKFVRSHPAKKHDHFLIPSGTVHCSCTNCMVLEISATPYIFTFKLYDWDRVGLDGRPRAINIEHGMKNIQFDRDEKWVKENLINNFQAADDGSTKTGLHEREFIETRRYFFTERIKIATCGSVNMNNLIEGEEAIIEPVNNEFEPFVLHYAETFIIPASIKEYYIRPAKAKMKCGVLKAYVRG